MDTSSDVEMDELKQTPLTMTEAPWEEEMGCAGSARILNTASKGK